MATAEARTTLFNSVFMSATVCRTVDSKVASSITSTPAFACPRATRPSRPKISAKNAIEFSPRLFFCFAELCRQAPYQAARAHHVDQQKVDAAQDVVLIVLAHLLELAEIVERDRGLAAARIVKLEVGRVDAVIGGQHG